MATAWPTVCSQCQQVDCGCVKPVNSQPQRKTKRMYNRRWQRARLRFIKRNPLCVVCDSRGRVRPTQEVDHIKPHRGCDKLFWNEKNWQALCKRCHSRKTQREADRGRRVVVCGQPASGKTTYVKNNSAGTDIVFDYDKLVQCIQCRAATGQRNPVDLIGLIEAMREACVTWANGSATDRNLWMIIANRERAVVLADRLGAQLIDLDGPVGIPGGGG